MYPEDPSRMFCHPAGSPLALRSRRPRDPYRDVSVWGPRGEPVLCVHTLRVVASPNAELSAGWWQDEARPEGSPSPALCPVSSPAPRSPPPRLPSGTGVRRPQPPRGSRAGNGGRAPSLTCQFCPWLSGVQVSKDKARSGPSADEATGFPASHLRRCKALTVSRRWTRP